MKMPPIDHPVTSAWLEENGRRLDSRPYVSGAVEARVLLKRLAAEKVPLHEVTTRIFHAGREGRKYVIDPQYGVPFLGSTDILGTDLSTLPLLSKKQVDSNPLFALGEGWTLISRSGTVGRMAYARPDMAGMACSEHVMRVVPNPDHILPGYLYAYLSSRFGIPQVIERTYGTIIQHIEPHHVADLPVPLAPFELQSRIHECIASMALLRTQSIALHKKATERIFEHIGLIDPSRHSWLSNDRQKAFSVAQASSKTLRALNYDPRYLGLCSKLQEQRYDRLGELCDPHHFKSGIIFKRIDADPPFAAQLIGQREAFQVRPEGRWISRKSIEGLGLMVSPGTTMIAAHGTLGETELYCRSVYVTKRTSAYAFSGDFVRCIPLAEKVLPGYLFAFLRSEAAFRILRSISIGGKQQAPHPTLLWNIPVPRLEREQEQDIHALVESGAQMFDKSLQLEEDAWEIIENWIIQEGAGVGRNRADGTAG